ncbi:DNA repair protein XRCC1 [Halyomorpha halys]|uniref:DNA repair protein XRCC1 n=1 Tax=Halyomorpha halys TaxID=286706 RepID=UPI0006D4F637
MSLVKFERIVSVSSEDPSFPAENLLKSNYNDKKWKCKLPGEKQISVVIQMDSPVAINAIDIGNYGSAFIEIFVGKSSNPDDFKVLIVASSLMTLHEAKLGENISNVRFFKEDNLAKPVSLEKWDRIKLVCSQPYNKFIQYGLSFVVVHSKNLFTPNSAVSTLGKFNLKNNESDEISVGSLFAKRKADPVPELKGAAAIRAASTSGIINQKKPSIALYAQPEEENVTGNIGQSSETNISSSENNPSSPVLRKDNKKKQKPDKPRTPKAKPNPKFNGSPALSSTSALANGESSNRKAPSKNKEDTKKNIVPKKAPEKPFNQLMGGVVFAISGFQNPYRSDLRNKALAMGAKYRPDWDSTCTHLLCAFPNTPKFNQVLGQGKIVTKEWIETCYSRRMRLPWRRFALHPPDKNLPESEEEIIEYVPRPPSPVDNRRRVSPGPASSGEDTEEEIERWCLFIFFYLLNTLF